MRTILLLLFLCGLQSAAQSQTSDRYIGADVNGDWAYRYRITHAAEGWSGHVDLRNWQMNHDPKQPTVWVPWTPMKITKQSKSEIEFEALFGVPGKALPATWRLLLEPTNDEGFHGKLTGLNMSPPYEVDLLFRELTPEMERALFAGSSRSPELEAGFYPGEALLYEVGLAKQLFEAELPIAKRVAELRSDDEMRGGIQREWVGPYWVRLRVTAENSMYFGRIWGVYLGGSKVTDEDVLALSALTELRELYLNSTGITDAGLARIGNLHKIRLLHLRDTKISDRSLGLLESLTTLKELYLHETRVSEEGVKRLRSKLPNAQILK